MRNRWIVLLITLLSLALCMTACGEDSPVENPDTDSQTDAPVASIPEDTTAPEEKIEIPTMWGDYTEFMEYAFEYLDFEPFAFDYEFDTVREGEYYNVCHENMNPEGYMPPEGGCITMVLSPGGGLARIYVEFAADIDPDYVIGAAISPFDGEDSESQQLRDAIAAFIAEAMKPEADYHSTMEYGDVVVYLDKGYKDFVPLYFYVEAKGVSEFMANYPIENAAE